MTSIRIPAREQVRAEVISIVGVAAIVTATTAVFLDTSLLWSGIPFGVAAMAIVTRSVRRSVIADPHAIRVRDLTGSSTVAWNQVELLTLADEGDARIATLRWCSPTGLPAERAGRITTQGASELIALARANHVPVKLATRAVEIPYEARVEAYETGVAVGDIHPMVSRPTRSLRDWLLFAAAIFSVVTPFAISIWNWSSSSDEASPGSEADERPLGAELFMPTTGNVMWDERRAAEAQWRARPSPGGTIDCTERIPLDSQLGAPRFVRVVGPFGTLTANERFEIASPSGIGGRSLIGGFDLDELDDLADATGVVVEGSTIAADKARQVWVGAEVAGVWFLCD